ncbi:protein of unknown function [Candidatus Nitrosocosmicus franklandus]|uniref:Uncharacterized protein n=1 Tax=Candidatus Nitrosocosmicus franklandianus TaxID=1798806 RepID=A0A484II83_9ARCH|nr:protein of unknown function [Candidatus Nitrosocosmicus franklandus]
MVIIKFLFEIRRIYNHCRINIQRIKLNLIKQNYELYTYHKVMLI